MHSVFLSEKVIFRQLKAGQEIDGPIKGSDTLEEIESKLLKRFAKKHVDVNFDRLPSCPHCLEKIDASVTGLQQAPSQLTRPGNQNDGNEETRQAPIWPGALADCKVCQLSENVEVSQDHLKCQVCENR